MNTAVSARPAIRAIDLPAWAGRLSLPWRLFLAAVALRLVSFLCFFLYSWFRGHGGFTDPHDPVEIDRWGWYIATQLHQGRLPDVRGVNLLGSWQVGFEYLVGFQYFLVGHHVAIPRLVNVALAAFTAPAAYWAAQGAGLSRRVASRAGWLTALWPLSIYWSGYDLLKDPLIWFLVALALLSMTRLTGLRSGLSGALAAGGMLLVRIYLGVMLYALIPLGALIRRDWRGLAILVTLLTAAEAALVLGLHQPPIWSTAPYHGNGVSVSQGQAAGGGGGGAGSGSGDVAAAQITGSGSDVATVVLTNDPRLIAKRLLVGGILAPTGPWFSFHRLLSPTVETGMYPGLAIWVLLIPFGVLGFVRAVRSRVPAVINVAVLSITLWASLAYLYAGTAYRQREMAFPATLILVAIGLEGPLPRRWWWPVYALYILAGLAVLALHVQIT